MIRPRPFYRSNLLADTQPAYSSLTIRKILANKFAPNMIGDESELPVCEEQPDRPVYVGSHAQESVQNNKGPPGMLED